jgi:chemotaxis protein methyltransferase CheR
VTVVQGSSFGPPTVVDAVGYARLAGGLRVLLGIDLDQYRPAQMWRRVNSFADSHRFRDVDALLAACRTEPALLADLRDMLTINVSEFFRDPEAWRQLEGRVGKALAQGASFRAWSAGCSTGFEPYSLAILAAERAPDSSVSVLATDLDRTALEVARAGRYGPSQVTGLSAERRGLFLVPDGDGWLFRPEIRAGIRFRRHDLLTEPAGVRSFDLVICRNVVIYFTEEAKAAVHRRLAEALRPGGLLFVGAAEAILQPGRFGLVADGPGFYVRAD